MASAMGLLFWCVITVNKVCQIDSFYRSFNFGMQLAIGTKIKIEIEMNSSGIIHTLYEF